MKLDITKFETIAIQADQQSTITGGGWGRSQRRAGDCNYSSRNPAHDCHGDVGGCKVERAQQNLASDHSSQGDEEVL